MTVPVTKVQRFTLLVKDALQQGWTQKEGNQIPDFPRKNCQELGGGGSFLSTGIFVTFDPMFSHQRIHFNETIQNLDYRWGWRSIVECLPAVYGTLSAILSICPHRKWTKFYVHIYA